MTTTITKGQESYLPAPHGPSTYRGTASTSDLTWEEAMAALHVTLPRLWDESTREDAENDYAAQARAVSSLLNREVNRWEVRDAMNALDKLNQLQAGNCLVEMYGWRNTDDNRDYWLDYEQRQLRVAVQNLTAGMVR